MLERLYLIGLLRRYEGSIKHTAQHAGISSKHVRSLSSATGSTGATSVPPLRSATSS